MKKIAILLISAAFLTSCNQTQLANNSPTAASGQKNNLSAFVNEKYSYKFSYPAQGYVGDSDMIADPVNSSGIDVYQQKEGGIFAVNVYPNTENDLKKFVEKTWTKIKEQKEQKDIVINQNVGDIVKTELNERDAYKFTLDYSYVEGLKEDYLLDKKNIHIFTEYNGLIYEIHFSSVNENSKNILSTFEFFDNKTNPLTNQQANIANCKNNYKSEQDGCLLTYAKNQIFHLEKDKDYTTCREMTPNGAQQSECYWLFAMKSRDSALCSSMSPIANETYLTKENCEKEINYKNGNTEWKLSGGYPPYYNENGILYFGKSELTGWLEQKADSKYTYFNLTPESKNNLPPYLQRFTKFRIEYFGPSSQDTKSIPEEALAGLRGSSQANPVKISTKQLSHSSAHLEEELNEFPAFYLSYLK